MSKQLLLLEDVENVGKKGEVVSVKEGFAFNYLLPQGIALVATEHALRKQAKLQEERKKIAEHDRKEAEALSMKLANETITIFVKVDHEGHMYGSVSQLDIAEKLKEQTGIELDKKFVQLKHAIKQTGVFEITLRLKEGVTAIVHVKIVPEQMPS
jgi:large subunit ribosomal protein L9